MCCGEHKGFGRGRRPCASIGRQMLRRISRRPQLSEMVQYRHASRPPA
ncbi:unnamed protein product [Mycena citricolor]|uniref:Uncharacterized protein n=1 Tax=Mycena citricolor TaxID=2018698 RepID=A0AAD2GZC0_9AGAR|nr:unnamed protein product [Mycena citricolor]CAK5282801.1 unnamed protein product [Mycena citricolor]